jgi:hypothetical protein
MMGALAPVQMAREWYRAHLRARSFEVDLGMFLLRGHVVSAPEGFMMGHVVNHERVAEEWEKIGDCVSGGNCWYVWVLAGGGGLRWFMDRMPFYLPWVAFHRRGKLKLFPTETLAKLVMRQNYGRT